MCYVIDIVPIVRFWIHQGADVNGFDAECNTALLTVAEFTQGDNTQLDAARRTAAL